MGVWVLRSDTRWRYVPERQWLVVRVCTSGSRAGSGQGRGPGIGPDLRSAQDGENRSVTIDFSVVPTVGCLGPKKGDPETALGRSRRSLTTKIQLLAEELGPPMAFHLTGSQTHDCRQPIALLGDRQPEAMISNKGYDTDPIPELPGTGQHPCRHPARRTRKLQRAFDRAPVSPAQPHRTIFQPSPMVPPPRHPLHAGRLSP